jgi:hypothetical protein
VAQKKAAKDEMAVKKQYAAWAAQDAAKAKAAKEAIRM